MPDEVTAHAGAERFSAALSELEAELDWRALGQAYCHEGGEEFFCSESIEGVREAGLHFATDVAGALEALPSSASRGHSLYIGAALAELAPMLCESLVLGRAVHACALPGTETEVLNTALERVEERLKFTLPRIDTTPLADQTLVPCDHVWMVSVLTDPEAFPALHDELYQRSGTDLATGTGALPHELLAARTLVASALDALALPGVFHTTDEEFLLLREACELRGLELEEPEQGRLSGIVGDVVRCYRLSPAPRGA